MTGANDYDAILERLLSESPADARERALTEADRRIGDRPVVLHGCGDIGCRLMRAMRAHGVEPVAFSDNSPAKAGTTVDGVPVLSVADACERYGATGAFVVSVWSPGAAFSLIRDQLAGCGAEVVLPLTPMVWKYADEMLPHFLYTTPDVLLARRDEIVAAFALLSDDESREEFLGQLEWRLTGDNDCLLPPSTDTPYFEPDIVPLSADESVVDCGAFDGDTLREFVGRMAGAFDSYEAFEPDPTNFERLSAYTASLPADVSGRVRVHQAAVADCAGTLRFGATGGTDACASDDGDIEVACVRLDDTVARATYVKMDIEGAETGALLGAERIIGEQAPKLAICVYHTPVDFFTIPLLIHRLEPDADMYCRCYMNDGLETVVYAVPR